MKKIKVTIIKDHPLKSGERMGQYIWNAMAYSGYWQSPEANPLFFISDEDFMRILLKYEKS